MFTQVFAAVYQFLNSLVHVYTTPQLLGYAVMFTVVVIVYARAGRGPKQIFRRTFLTDLAYSAWFPVYTILIGIPIAIQLAAFVVTRAPFVRLGLLGGLPWWLRIPIWLIVADFVLYWLHRSMHQTSWLWALHKIHHSQTELNPLTTWRVHWLEFLYLNTGAFVTGMVLGDMQALHPIAIALLAASQFAQHSDIDWTYGPVGRLIVSPRFHARHHSTAAEDLNTNFGSLLVIWDRLFGTARMVSGRAPGYGLVAAEDNVPKSFFLQLLFPLSLMLVRRGPTTSSGLGECAKDG